MAYQSVFERYEFKYMIDHTQKERILKAFEPYMALDRYGRTTIRNIYFDTDSYQLIRNSIEKPVYKEKLRIRSYCKAKSDSAVFVELKKKYDSIVYKRRLSLPGETAMKWICGEVKPEINTQISNEIDYFLGFYKTLKPKLFIAYEREAFYSKDGSDFRITFDENVLCRREELLLESDVWGFRILPKEKVLMEIKCSGGIPLWMTHILSDEHIFKTSFSKYGTAYQTLIFPEIKEDFHNDRISVQGSV